MAGLNGIHMGAFIILFTILISFFIGWYFKQPVISIIGASVFLLMLIFKTFLTYKIAKLCKDSHTEIQKEVNKNEKNIVEKINSFLIAFITFGSLIGTIAYAENSNILFIPAVIVWVGTILTYFISGIIMREVGNFPLRWGYGGWDIEKFRKSQ